METKGVVSEKKMLEIWDFYDMRLLGFEALNRVGQEDKHKEFGDELGKKGHDRSKVLDVMYKWFNMREKNDGQRAVASKDTSNPKEGIKNFEKHVEIYVT